MDLNAGKRSRDQMQWKDVWVGGGGGEVDFKVHGLEELLGKMLPFTGS